MGFHAFLKVNLLPDIDIVFEHIAFEEKVKDADILITGDGEMDLQSAMGKAPSGVARMGKRYNIPVVALCAHVTDDAYELHLEGISSIFLILKKR